MKEDALVDRLSRENEEFLKAKQAHAELAKQLDELEKKVYLTPQDEMMKNQKKNWPGKTRWKRY
jgi:hypothetical protein